MASHKIDDVIFGTLGAETVNNSESVLGSMQEFFHSSRSASAVSTKSFEV